MLIIGKMSKQTEQTNARPKAKRKFMLDIDQLKEMANTDGLLKEFIKAYEAEPELIAPIILATAKGALRQQTLKV